MCFDSVMEEPIPIGSVINFEKKKRTDRTAHTPSCYSGDYWLKISMLYVQKSTLKKEDFDFSNFLSLIEYFGS